MSARLSPDVLDPRFYERLGEVPESLFDDHLYWSVELLERYAREWALEIAHRLALPAALEAAAHRGATAGDLVAALGLVPGFVYPLSWVLEQLAAAGEVHAAGAPGRAEGRRFRAAGELRPARREPVREALLDHGADNAPSVELLDAAGEAWPRVARGEARGEDELLSPDKIGLWLRYFANDNPVYALNNRLAAVAAVNRLPAAGEIRILEVGAGAGSGSLALLEALEAGGHLGRLEVYHLTEPAAMLRRRATRTITGRWPGVPLTEGALDVDRPWSGASGQGVEAASLDLVLGVNVLHVAGDLGAALREARTALRPGGRLVLGECLRPFPGQPVAAEMTFLPLEGFREVRTDPELRPHPGFLTPELWMANLERAGFVEIEVVPDVRALREIYPRVAAGAVCGRRPVQ